MFRLVKHSLPLMAFFVLAGWCASAVAAPVTIERIVSKINDEIITLSELQDFVKPEIEKLRKKFKGEELERRSRELELSGLDLLIENKLVLQRAKAMNLGVSQKEIENALNVVVRRNKITASDLRRYLQTKGTTLEAYRETLRKRILLRKVEGLEVTVRVTVSEEEIAAYHKANQDKFRKGEARKVRQIFFPVKKDASEDEKNKQRLKAEKAHPEVSKNGDDFAAQAKKLSEGPSAKNGGLLGFVKKGELFPELEQVIFSTPKGKFSRPTRTRVGYHIVYVEEIRPGELITLDRVAGKIRSRLFVEKRGKRRREWIAELKRAAFLEVNYDPQATRRDAGLASLFRDVREQVTFRLVGVKLSGAAELLQREQVFWAYGSNRGSPRWKSDKLKVSKDLQIIKDDIGILEKTYREFVNPDPSAHLFLFEYNYLLPNSYLGKLSFAEVIKTFSLDPKKKRLAFDVDTKRAQLIFEVDVQKTRSIVADPKDIKR